MSRADKTKAVAELAERFRSAAGAVLTEYRGLTVAELRELRTALGEHADYVVVKNTLTQIAVKEAEVEGMADMLVGPSAIAFITGDPVEASKGLKDFGKEHPALLVKGGYLDGNPLTPDEIKKLADLESREVLLAKLAGAMKGSMSQAVSLFAAPLAQTARSLEALRAKAEADPTVLGGAGEPAATATAEPEAAAEEETQPSAGEEPAEADEAPAEEAQEG